MYVVRKPVNIGGRRRIIGEILEDKEVISPTLIRSGHVAKIDSGLLDTVEGAVEPLRPMEGDTSVNVPIITKDGTMVILAAPETISNVFRVLQASAEEAIKEIKVSEDEDMLIILDACDTRKTVREAVRNRAGELKLAEKEEAVSEETDGGGMEEIGSVGDE